MGGGGVDIGIGTVTRECCPCSKERSCCVDDVIEDNACFSGDISNDVVHVCLAWTWAILVEDRELGTEDICKLLCPLCASHIRSDDDRRGEILLAEVLCEDGPCMEGIDGNVEESLDLVAMEIEGDDVVCAGFFEEMGNEFCGDRFAWFCDAVLASVREVGEDHVDRGSEAQLRCLAEEEEFHDIFVRCTASCLEEIDNISPDRFLKADIPFSAAECSACNFSQGDMELPCEVFGEILVR